ncbi:MAG: DUF4229 domain-containing protein [Mycobacteriaceae bacterium]
MSNPDVPTPVDVPDADEVTAAKKRLARDVLMFTAARAGLVVLLAAAIMGVSALLGATVPLVVAFLIAVVAALPLSILLFNGLRKRVNQGIVVVDARRRAEKDQLHARLQGAGRDGEDDEPERWEQQ